MSVLFVLIFVYYIHMFVYFLFNSSQINCPVRQKAGETKEKLCPEVVLAIKPKIWPHGRA